MAKKRSTALAPRITMTAPRPVAPIIKVSAPRAAPHHKKHHKKGGGGGKGLTDVQAAIAGAVVGFVEKQGILDKLPALPMLGKKGTAALGLHYFAKGKGGMLRDAKIALCVLAGYDLAKTGAIVGTVSPQVAGVSRQV